MSAFSIEGHIVDIENRDISYGKLTVREGRIESIEKLPDANIFASEHGYILPGFIDSHIHIESSMLVPSEFARMAVVHGTVGTISDPHEIANVCGMGGVEFMIENGKTVPFKFHFGAPSCVPATVFETAGAALTAAEVDTLLQKDEINYLSEMMNFPGVLFGDEEVMKKIASAKKYGKPVDGHAPGLRGEEAKKYIEAGISTDHECFTAEEALDKLKYGMKILIREGSAAKNFNALVGLMHEHHERMMFCSDDKHPDSLAEGHINQLCARAVAFGIDVFKVLQAACINPVKHYNMRVGMLRPGDPADFIMVNDLEEFKVGKTYIDGHLVAEDGISKIHCERSALINHFHCEPKKNDDLRVPFRGETEIPVIEALDGQLITNKLLLHPKVEEGMIVSDTEKDVLKMVVVNRYHPAPVAKAFIRNFGIKQGALASSVAHDSHNIVAVGVDDKSLLKAINGVIQENGGVSCVYGEVEKVLGLPVAGLMSNEDGYSVARAYTEIDRMAKEELGSTLQAPFMTLSFMALLVIPHLKLSDRGLFDGDLFQFVEQPVS
ncbi:MAG: adenine deaminase [Chitinophagaceae bacterium]|nr:adenine deaminase [Chitinophagaceae bacterium]